MKSHPRFGLGLCALLGLVLSACQQQPLPPPPAGIGQVVEWEALQGFDQDSLSEAWPGLLTQCRVLAKRAEWQTLCRATQQLPQQPSDAEVRAFLKAHFVPHRVNGKDGKQSGLITGYYEPLLFGSDQPTERFRYPVYGRPSSLLTLKLGERYPELQGQRVRGRLVGQTVEPFFDRAAIDGPEQPLAGEEILWVDDPYQLFFLQIQGSGRVQMTDGREIALGYADQNGHAYRSIGKVLIEQGELEREAVSLFTIRQWLDDHPSKAQALLNTNPSYVFFHRREQQLDEGPRGSLNVPLIAERAVAVDRSILPLGSGVWLETELPDAAKTPWKRLLWAQDTGGAIVGPVRADVFFGRGDRAERLAGTMKQSGQIIVLLPKASLGSHAKKSL